MDDIRLDELLILETILLPPQNLKTNAVIMYAEQTTSIKSYVLLKTKRHIKNLPSLFFEVFKVFLKLISKGLFYQKI
jgi:hypothetical protein